MTSRVFTAGEMEKASSAIYLIVDAVVADDISAMLRQSAQVQRERDITLFTKSGQQTNNPSEAHSATIRETMSVADFHRRYLQTKDTL